jgi:hypothetical protein
MGDKKDKSETKRIFIIDWQNFTLTVTAANQGLHMTKICLD